MSIKIRLLFHRSIFKTGNMNTYESWYYRDGPLMVAIKFCILAWFLKATNPITSGKERFISWCGIYKQRLTLPNATFPIWMRQEGSIRKNIDRFILCLYLCLVYQSSICIYTYIVGYWLVLTILDWICGCSYCTMTNPKSKAHMGHTWVLSAPGGPRVGSMNHAIRKYDILWQDTYTMPIVVVRRFWRS